MVPYTNPLDRGVEYRRDETSVGDECCVCGRKFSIKYWTMKGNGPYCADHFPRGEADNG